MFRDYKAVQSGVGSVIPQRTELFLITGERI